MTVQEFSNEFDVLYNNITSNQAPGLDEYEKSVFLTKAQENIVISLYNGRLTGDSFEKTEELRRYLSSLVKTYSTTDRVVGEGLTRDSYFFNIPEDVWFITYEAASSEDDRLGSAKGTSMEVVPITQDELYKTKRNPFRMPNKRRVLRMDTEGTIVELISAYKISEYQMRYLSKLEPIILSDLSDGLSIDGLTEETECKLNPALHRVILEMAVSLALKKYS